MSPDDIFAAQFWPWPDPAIKRDPQGRVLFVNAAFLALYGGRVEDWRGNAVGGWPAPQVAPHRFETRMAGMDGSEQVYDWMEQTLADGNAFALARNVTVFMQAPEPDPAVTSPIEAVPEIQDQIANPLNYHTQTHQDPFQAEPAHAETAQSEEIVTQEPEQIASEVSEPSQPADEGLFDVPAAAPAAVAPAAAAAAAAIAVPNIEIPDIEIPSDDAYAMTEVTAEAETAQTEIEAPVAEAPIEVAAEPAPEREFERRALPIESDSAVLGNNWRDAVIAKAVGAETVAEDAVAAEAVIESSTPEVKTEDGNGSVRILLAEDNAINALLTRTLLEAEGHTVETVEDGALAVEAMRTSKFDLIFMDMRMPNMDGLEATRKIRALPNVGFSLPIIALTANAFDDDRNACFDSGMNDFMTKPVSAEELSEKVRDWTSEEAKKRLKNAA